MEDVKTEDVKSIDSELTKVGLEEFLEDVFGLNIRSAKTIWTLFTRPRDYFNAARFAGWKQRYTPSIRLWLGLMTLIVALQFIWAKPDGAFMQMVENAIKNGLQTGLDSSGTEKNLESFDFKDAIRDTMKLNTLLYPFIFIAAMSSLAFFYRAWGEKLSYVVRQRYIFGVLIPASVIGLVSTILMTFVSGSIYQLVGFAQTGLIMLMYGITAYMGPYAHMEIGEKIGRSIFLSMTIFIVLVVAQFISYTLAMWFIIFPALKTHFGT